MRQRDFGGTSGFRGLAPEKIVAVATNARQTGKAGASWDKPEKTGVENVHSGVEVENASIARVGKPTA